MIEAKIICDSIWNGNRLTTIAASYPLWIHAQVMTYRMWSRNAASNRAIPVSKMIDKVVENPAIPLKFGVNRPGMSADEYLEGDALSDATAVWMNARDSAVHHCRVLSSLGVHKEITNRLLMPFQHITTLITATDWGNFFNQRLSHEAQPEIHELASQIKSLLDENQPKHVRFHCPFITSEEFLALNINEIEKVSVARCARVSYLNHEGGTDIEKDVTLYERLKTSGHMTPFEHVAYYAKADTRFANLLGWEHLRYKMENK